MVPMVKSVECRGRRVGIPTIGFGPSKEKRAHIVDEYIELDALCTAAEAYLSMINHIMA